MECLSVLLPHIGALRQAVEVVDQVHQLLIILILVEGYNWDPIVELVTKRVNCVVHNDKILQLSVRDYPQVFDVYTFFRPDAVISIESVLYELPLGV